VTHKQADFLACPNSLEVFCRSFLNGEKNTVVHMILVQAPAPQPIGPEGFPHAGSGSGGRASFNKTPTPRGRVRPPATKKLLGGPARTPSNFSLGRCVVEVDGGIWEGPKNRRKRRLSAAFSAFHIFSAFHSPTAGLGPLSRGWGSAWRKTPVRGCLVTGFRNRAALNGSGSKRNCQETCVRHILTEMSLGF